MTNHNYNWAFKEQERKALRILELDLEDTTGFTLWPFYSRRVIRQEVGWSQLSVDVATKE
jgi:hypothetical protein